MRVYWGRYCQVRYLIWQAQRAGDKDTSKPSSTKHACFWKTWYHDVAIGLSFLWRQPNWQSKNLPRATSKEMSYGRKKKASLVSTVRLLNLGSVVPRLCAGRSNFSSRTGKAIARSNCSAAFRWNRSSLVRRHQAARFAVENRDFQHAEQIARKAVQANPDDFQERIWLVHILLASERQAEAVKELRDAVALSPGDPDRWLALVTFLIFTKQPIEAEKVIREAEAKLPPSKASISLARMLRKDGPKLRR